MFKLLTVFVFKEEVIIEAAKMENWRGINVSLWQNKQQPTTAGPINKGAPPDSKLLEKKAPEPIREDIIKIKKNYVLPVWLNQVPMIW